MAAIPNVSPTPLRIASRVAASLLGGWAFVWGFVALGVALLLAAGMRYGEALTLVYLLAFLIYLGALLWAFAAASLARVWIVLAGGGALMTGAAWLLTRA
ncbi:MAG TPA: iron uptake protein [Roseateles sp.]|nr:iron uptake protein [Roseateles sp.]